MKCLAKVLIAATAVLLVLPGCDWRDRGVSLEPRVPAGLQGPVEVRVLLFRAKTIQVGGQEDDFSIWDGGGDNELLTLEAGQVAVLHRVGDQWRVDTPNGKSLLDGRVFKDTRLMVRSRGEGLLSTTGEEKLALYRGALRLIADEDGMVRVVNLVEMEDYLKGVVGCEAYSNWYMAALRAQAIASRTYAIWQIRQRGGRGDWDLGSDQGSQVYGGVGREHERVTRAVEETRGAVLVYGEPGEEKLIPAYYSSTCGGHTADAASIFGGDAWGCMKGVPCPYCAGAAPAGLFRWEGHDIGKDVVSERLHEKEGALLADLGPIVGIEVVTRSASGRVTRVALRDEAGKTELMGGERFRLALTTREKPLRSSWYWLVDAGESWLFYNGRGFGHGVGMCQWGAQGMAMKGKNAEQILNHYYSGAKVVHY